MRISALRQKGPAERIFQTPAGRTKSTGEVKGGPQGPTETVTLQGGRQVKPLLSLSGETLLSLASKSALDAAAGTSLPASVTSAFAPAEFLMLNSGDYHGAQHPINVGNTIKTLSQNAGRTEERSGFLNQVALIHDADERILMGPKGEFSFQEGAKPARVPVTLAWMDLNQEGLQERFDWDKGSFQEAKTLIAGTEHPLNDEVGPKSSNNLPGYDGKSAKGLLSEQLLALPAERRGQVTEEIQLLRFADQSAEYLSGKDGARNAVEGLAQEIHVPAAVLLTNTPDFVSGLGKDNEAFGDLPQKTMKSLVSELDIDAPVYSPEQLHGFLSDQQHAHLTAVKGGL